MSEQLSAALSNANTHFDKQAAIYESLTGGSTRRIAEAALSKLPAFTSESRILDNACGPGIVAELILNNAATSGVSPPPRITATDLAAGMVAQLEAKKARGGWETVETKVLDAAKLEGVESNAYDAAIMNFGLFAVPDADEGAREMHRVLKSGGSAAVTTWKVSPPVDLLQAVVGAIRPDCVERVFPVSKEWLTQEKLRDVMVAGGFTGDLVVDEAATVWNAKTKEEFLDSLTGTFWSRIWADWTAEEQATIRPEMEKLTPVDDKGEVNLEMVAWVCVAKKD
ncbi:S-adenosyl-L-methionine-dependent methyltransferase [Microthyrium microscopicum]|uniref:S-adenosyl-L-methionine-dependent methyltransferase n=1 Tax=Microthyrium microscopicum TaxID=703497 RepID=A0A6A6ULM4_9PEZI|nr:S-adenosyl-L-methionine-dependent methyltransferase [Microthyrium microscopicum]